MAEMLGLSRLAYGDIERCKTDLTDSRLNQIASVLQLSPADILAFADRMTNFFDQCSGAIGLKSGTQNNHYDQRELEHELEKSTLVLEKYRAEIEKLKAERDKAELEARYWREKQTPS
ncbi:helix-turn-helix domain-containing protein [Fibrella aquatilis]